MSLFNTVDFWCTRCGEEETFGFNSLVVGDIDESEQNKIIVGSFSGLLRIYQVTYAESEQGFFKPSDLLLEMQLSESIIQVIVGRLVSGSRAVHLGVIHPRTISVYSFTSLPGSTEHGNQFELRLIYEQPLQSYNYQVIAGPFGGVKKRDFLCALAVDGSISFFEQETFVYETQLPAFLLPSPITYIPETDVFVTLSADWCIEAYKYQDLVTAKKKISPTWSYNLGETLLDIQTRRYAQQETFIIALSEHTVSCFDSTGSLKFAKRLPYTPMCFYSYVNEYDNNLMILIVSDSGMMFVYEKHTLRWSAKLPFIPICIFRANLGIDGAIVMLSDSGDLNCSFLGTRPTLFVAPSLENSITSSKNINKRLEALQNQIRDFKINNSDSLSLSVQELEVSVTLKILPYDRLLNYCQIVLDLTPSCPLSNVHISFELSQPAYVRPASYTISSLYERTALNPVIEIGEDKHIIVSKLNVTAVVCYMATNAPRFIRRFASIPPKFILHPYIITNIDDELSYQLNLHTNIPPPLLTSLFQELRAEPCTDDEVIGFHMRYNPTVKCTVSVLKSKYGFSLASNSTAMMYLMISQLIQRCRNLKSTAGKQNDKISFEYNEKISLDELFETINNFLNCRNQITQLQTQLEKLSAQYRLIQRRLLIKLKDKIPSNLNSLQVLYRSTYDKIIDTIRLIEDSRKDFIVKAHNLQVVIDFTFELVSMTKNIPIENVLSLKVAMNTTSSSNDMHDWAERTLANVMHLLRTNVSTTNQVPDEPLPPPDKSLIDPDELANTIMTAFSRLLGDQLNEDFKTQRLNIKNDQERAVSPILELDEDEDANARSKKMLFVKHQKLLKKRHSKNFIDVTADL